MKTLKKGSFVYHKIHGRGIVTNPNSTIDSRTTYKFGTGIDIINEQPGVAVWFEGMSKATVVKREELFTKGDSVRVKGSNKYHDDDKFYFYEYSCHNPKGLKKYTVTHPDYERVPYQYDVEHWGTAKQKTPLNTGYLAKAMAASLPSFKAAVKAAMEFEAYSIDFNKALNKKEIMDTIEKEKSKMLNQIKLHKLKVEIIELEQEMNDGH